MDFLWEVAVRTLARHASGGRGAELKGPRKLLRIRPEIFDFEPDLGLKLGQTKPKISGTVPTNRHTTIPKDSDPISACFDDDPKLLNCETAQPRGGGPRTNFESLSRIVGISSMGVADPKSKR